MQVSHIAKERQALLHASNPHAELVSSRTLRGVVFHSLSTQSAPSRRTSSLSSTEAPQQAVQRSLHPSSSTGTQGFRYSGALHWGPGGAPACRDPLGPAGSGHLAAVPSVPPGSIGSDLSDSGTPVQHVPSAPPMELGQVHSAFTQDPGGSTGLPGGSARRMMSFTPSVSSAEGSELYGSSPGAVSQSQPSWDWQEYPRLGQQPPGLQPQPHEPVYGRESAGHHGSLISSRC